MHRVLAPQICSNVPPRQPSGLSSSMAATRNIFPMARNPAVCCGNIWIDISRPRCFTPRSLASLEDIRGWRKSGSWADTSRFGHAERETQKGTLEVSGARCGSQEKYALYLDCTSAFLLPRSHATSCVLAATPSCRMLHRSPPSVNKRSKWWQPILHRCFCAGCEYIYFCVRDGNYDEENIQFDENGDVT